MIEEDEIEYPDPKKCCADALASISNFLQEDTPASQLLCALELLRTGSGILITHQGQNRTYHLHSRIGRLVSQLAKLQQELREGPQLLDDGGTGTH